MISRRALMAGAFALGAMPRIGLAQPATPTPEGLIAAAAARAAAPYRPPSRDLAAPFDALDYDSYRAVRPLPGKAARLPLGGQFRADLLPPGWLFREPVHITLPGHDTRFAPDLFSYDPALVALPTPLPDMTGMGFSGLRVQYPLNRADHWDEVLVLQGASYFRALAADTVYGLSARGFALGTGGAGPEEFPLTEEIHVFRADEAALHFGCLIDSPRATAAFIATLAPGAVTRMACRLHLFARARLEDVGIAPLTSMFQHSALGPARIDDFRPAVHDSDVLVMENGAGEVIWRPLANPARLQMSAFADQSPGGFGLLQSPRGFAAFRDAEAAYHRRPSAWITPQGDWGRGAVMLLEIPTENEFADNIVAFWRPEAPLEPGAHVFAYDLDWLAPGPEALPTAPLPLAPAHMASGIDPNNTARRLFVLDYTGQPPNGAAMQPEFGAMPGAEISGVALYPLEGTPDTWRLSFLLTPEPGVDVAELRMVLRGADGAALAPVWLYRWTRSAGGRV
jgi:periplasmic glucans biosynthesis protein